MKSFARHHTGFFVAAGLFLLGVSHAALATPPEAFTFTNINSDGILNSPANVQTSAAVVGGFALRRIDVSGTLTSVNASTWMPPAGSSDPSRSPTSTPSRTPCGRRAGST